MRPGPLIWKVGVTGGGENELNPLAPACHSCHPHGTLRAPPLRPGDTSAGRPCHPTTAGGQRRAQQGTAKRPGQSDPTRSPLRPHRGAGEEGPEAQGEWPLQASGWGWWLRVDRAWGRVLWVGGRWEPGHPGPGLHGLPAASLHKSRATLTARTPGRPCARHPQPQRERVRGAAQPPGGCV